MFSLSKLSSKAKAVADWLDKLPGFGAAGVGVAVGLVVPASLFNVLVIAGVVYLVCKFDLGNVSRFFK